MENIITQVSIFGVLLSFLVVGFLYKKSPQTVKEYALGKSRTKTPALITTLVATSIGGGSIIGISAALYEQGAWLFLASCAMPIGYCITSLVIIPRLSKYYGCYSIAEVIGRMYGVHARKIIGISAFIFCLGILAAQIKSLHWVMEHVSKQNDITLTLMALIIVMLYSSIGGITSVIKTDVIQFFIFMVIVPAIAYHMIQTEGGITQIVKSLPKDKLAFVPEGGILGIIALSFLNLLPNLTPEAFHRFLIGRDCKANQAASYAVAFIISLSLIFVSCVAFIAASKFSNISPKEAIFVVVQNITSDKWMMMLFVIALIAMIVSTADSLINTGAVILVNDVITQKINEKQKVRILRGITIFSGIAATGIALLFSNILDIVLFFTEYYSIVISVPFIVGLFLKELRREAFWASVSIGIIVFSLLHFVYRDLSHEIFLTSIIASLCAYLISFFITKRNKLSKYSFSLYKTCDGIVQHLPIKNKVLAWIIIIFYFCSLVFNSKYELRAIITNGNELILGLLGCVLFFITKISKKYGGILILGVLWYCFSFFPLHSFLVMPLGIYLIFILCCSMFLLSYLLNSETFIAFLLFGGVVASIVFYSSENNNLTIAPLMHLLLLVGCIGVVTYIFSRKRKYSTNKATETKKSLEIFKKSLAAEAKYQNVLVNEDQTTEVSLEELKSNFIDYFYRLEVEQSSKLIICNSKHKKLNTVLPLSIFYKIIYSLGFNILYCTKNEEVSVKFYCEKNNQIKKVIVIHGDYSLLNRLKCLKDCPIDFPESILKWDIIQGFFEALDVKVQEQKGKLTILFPSGLKIKKNTSNVIDLKDLQKDKVAC